MEEIQNGTDTPTDSETAFENNTPAETQEGTATSENDNGAPSLEDRLNSFESETPSAGEGSELLSQVNDLGFIRNEMPFEIESVDQLKELVQLGFNAQKTTQEVANERKQFEQEFSERENEFTERMGQLQAKEQEFQEKLYEHQIFQQLLAQVQQYDPDFFNQLDSMYNSQMGAFRTSMNNPLMNQMKQQVSQLESQLKGFAGQQKEQQVDTIKQQWTQGLEQTQKEFGSKLRQLGVKADWNKVKAYWQNDSSNSMSVKDALLAVHGDAIMRALESQTKNQATKLASERRRAAAPQPQDNSNEQKPRSLSMDDIVERSFAKVVGN